MTLDDLLRVFRPGVVGNPKKERERPLKTSCEDDEVEGKNPLATEGPGQIIDVKG